MPTTIAKLYGAIAVGMQDGNISGLMYEGLKQCLKYNNCHKCTFYLMPTSTVSNHILSRVNIEASIFSWYY